MKRIAIIFNGDIQDRKGYFNAVLERAKRLYARREYHVDVFCLAQYDHWIVRQLRHTKTSAKTPQIDIDGVPINLIWYPFSLLDYFLSVKFHKKKLIEPIFIKQMVEHFKGYDLVSAHSAIPGLVALNVKKRFNIPYTVTWHGSDIHTEPYRNYSYKKLVSSVISGAEISMFVSKNLRDTAQQIFPEMKKSYVSYNGAADTFYKYDENKRIMVREQYGLTQKDKVVGFVGGLVPIKNVDIIPDIFHLIAKECSSITFWIIGDGKLRNLVEAKLQEKYPDINCKLFGNQPVSVMPDLMNCIDLLLLPSKNEGLPLVTVEALSCATNVVAANVGGIKEVIGDKNVIDHGDMFVERFSQRCSEIILNTELCPELPNQFDWATVVDNESILYRSILNRC